jgi:Chaperone of endosialidase
MKIITQNTQLQILFFCLLFCSTTAFAQVGIGNNNPQSVLDISSSNQTAPSNTDGLLIPRINNFPAANPGAAQDGMLVFVTGSGTPARGFYYWQQSTTSWISFGGSSSIDWRLGGNTITNVNTEYIGTNSNHDFRLRTNGIERFNFSSTGELRSYGNGSSGSPVYSWNADTNTGMYRINNDILGLSTAGVERMRIEANGTAVFNETGLATSDFRIESDNLQNMFFVDASTNRIGINTATPAAPLHFLTTAENVWLLQWDNDNATNGAAARFQNTNAANGNRSLMGITNYNGSASAASAVIGLSLNNTATGSGGVGVTGSANNESGTAVEGNLFFTGAYTGWAGYFNADVFSGGTYFGSDRRLKKNINPIYKALDIVKNIEPVSYFYDTDKYSGMGYDKDRLSYGFIAQDLERVLPELVKNKNLVLNSNTEKSASMISERKTESFKVVNYTLLIPILTQGIKEQQQIIESQNDKIKSLEKKLADLEAKVNGLLEN